MKSGKFRAVITALNTKYIHASLAPYCLLAGLKEYAKAVDGFVVESTINRPVSEALEKIIALSPDAVGLSCYIWNIVQMKTLAKMLKERLPQIKIIMGGPEVSYCAEKILSENPAVDFVLSGEGEKPFAMLMNALDSGKNSDMETIPGLNMRDNGKIILSDAYISDSTPPSPYIPEFFENLNGRISYIETTRGCPFRCAFCLSGRCGTVRYFDLDKAKENIISLANSTSKTVKFVDRTFNANKKRSDEIMRFIIENSGVKFPRSICFHFEIAGDLLDDETLEIIRGAPKGLFQFEIGLQSFNPETLNAIHRKTDVGRLENNIKKLVSFGNAHIHIDLIAGLPHEDIKSFENSFNRAFSLGADMLQLGFLKLLHGADIRENESQFPLEYSKNPPYEVTCTPWMNEDDLRRLHLCEDALERLSNSGRFPRTLSAVLESKKLLPFEFFMDCGKFFEGKTDKISLPDYVGLLYGYLIAKGFDKQIIRDCLVCDFLENNSSGILPKSLYVNDRRLRKLRLMLELSPETRPASGTKRALAILYGKNKAVYADYPQNLKKSGGERNALHFAGIPD